MIEMGGLDRGWKENDKIHSRLCKRVLGVLRVAGSNVAQN
jgi:hypothetical protein